MEDLMLGWTTFESRAEALEFSRKAVDAKVTACAQIDGPITSIYPWKGKVEEAQEFRALLKFPAHMRAQLTAWVDEHHPYETPEWVVLDAKATAAYQAWAVEHCRTTV